ncbi:MAG: glycosyl hydrolase family 18 protein [Lachnospirales bacterium]
MYQQCAYTYGPPLAVAPIKNVENVIKYSITQISPSKILMGVPLYGYDWNIPYVEGTKATSISPQRAIEIAEENNAKIEFDEYSQAPFFYYTKNNQNHIVWFENAKSIDAKMNIVENYNLAGVGYWSLDRYFPQNWLVLNSRFKIARL